VRGFPDEEAGGGVKGKDHVLTDDLVADNWRSNLMPTLADYKNLVNDFVSRRIPPKQFEKEYLEMFKSDPAIRSKEVYNILNEIFLDLDAYQDDPALLGKRDIDEAKLRRRVEHGLKSLDEHVSKE
jgi:hypothetical protein